ncbi:hypothetical protein BASA81_001162 [Batrachochytrium salamandrivorans]|nr:hypothetical protein BASA81_001162 [Batrachochytrium salamandrivorans]
MSLHHDSSFEQVAKRAIDVVFSRLLLLGSSAPAAQSKDEIWNDSCRIVLLAMVPSLPPAHSSSSLDWAGCVQKELFKLMGDGDNVDGGCTLQQAKQVLKERLKRLIFDHEQQQAQQQLLSSRTRLLDDHDGSGDVASRKRAKAARKRAREDLDWA